MQKADCLVRQYSGFKLLFSTGQVPALQKKDIMAVSGGGADYGDVVFNFCNL